MALQSLRPAVSAEIHGADRDLVRAKVCEFLMAGGTIVTGVQGVASHKLRRLMESQPPPVGAPAEVPPPWARSS
ncbi:hypothetical protein [Aeromicrobium sp.]|uniref:hypothetical protein n=1 Tax=Aeromicrobium sp. TaxID=1871063 RepID=UPI0030BC60D0